MNANPENDPLDAALPQEMRAAIARNWKWLLALGALLIFMGVLAVAAPLLSSIAVSIWIGAAFLVAGAGQIIQTFQAKGWEKGLGHVLIGLVYALGGLLILFQPLAGLVAFSLIVVASLLVSGAMRIVAGLRMRPREGWGWLVFAGVVALIAGALIFVSFPGSALWLLGTIAGISFMIEGWALVSVALAARDKA